MFDPLKKFWDRAAKEGGVVSRAPPVLLICIASLTVAPSVFIWRALDSKYSRIIQNRDAALGARNSQITLLAAQVKDLSDKFEQAKKYVPNNFKDPNAIFQTNEEVGRTVGMEPYPERGMIYFRSLTVGENYKQSTPFAFREYNLRIVSIGSENREPSAGEKIHQFNDVVCEIVHPK